MSESLQTCSVCSKGFVAQFTYQSELARTVDGSTQTRYFCSQRCLGQSHQAQSSVHCDACQGEFTVSRGSQVLYLRAKRHYACSESCRAQLLADERARAGSQSPSSVAVRPVPAHIPTAVAEPSAAASGSAPLGYEPPPQAQEVVAAEPELRLPELRPSEWRKAGAQSPMAGQPSRTSLSQAQATADGRPAGAPRVLAVFNHKGGTGKTTTAVTIAAGLAARGHRTLIVDTDAQGNVAVSLGLGKVSRSLYHVLVMGMPLKDAITHARENLDVLPSNETLAAAELYLAGRQNRDRILASRLAEAKSQYDYVVVDCSPSLSLLNQNALVFADSVLCPVACDYLSLVGVRQVVKTIKSVNRLLSHPVQLWGVLPTLYDRRARICNEALETLREHFVERCLPPVRSAIRVKEAPSQGKTVFEYDPDSDVARDYAATLDLIIEGHPSLAARELPTDQRRDLSATSDARANSLLAIA